jgi:hypothetical protein
MESKQPDMRADIASTLTVHHRIISHLLCQEQIHDLVDQDSCIILIFLNIIDHRASYDTRQNHISQAHRTVF